MNKHLIDNISFYRFVFRTWSV